jgi:magnesium chelatase family protein
LLASEQIFADLDGAIITGELSLDGGVRHVSGVLPIAVMARDQGLQTLYVPADDAAETGLIDGVDVYPVPSLLALVDHLTGHERMYGALRPRFHVGG